MVNRSAATLDAAFGALADPTRRAMVDRLARGDATVGELAAPFAMSLPAVSKHLRVLESAGLVSRRIEGRAHHLRLVPGPLELASDWIGDRRRYWTRMLAVLDDYLAPPRPRRRRKGARR